MLELNEYWILHYFQERRRGEPEKLDEDKTFLICPSVKIFPAVTSTNTELKEYIHSISKSKNLLKDYEGTVFLTDFQTAGKGRMGKNFFSPKSMGLYFSILTCPSSKNVNPLLITTHAAVAVKRAVKELYGINLSIKWVNDLYIKLDSAPEFSQKKVCGILAEGKFRAVENQTNCSSLEYCIMGIGLNLFTPKGDYPKELQDIAASLFGKYDELKYRDFDRNKLLAYILFHYFMICEEEEVLEEYRKENLVLGKRVSFYENASLEEAKVIEINKRGELQVRLDNGEEKTIFSGEVHLRT